MYSVVGLLLYHTAVTTLCEPEQDNFRLSKLCVLCACICDLIATLAESHVITKIVRTSLVGFYVLQLVHRNDAVTVLVP